MIRKHMTCFFKSDPNWTPRDAKDNTMKQKLKMGLMSDWTLQVKRIARHKAGESKDKLS